MRRSTPHDHQLSHKQERKQRRRKRQTAPRYQAIQSIPYPSLPRRPVHDDPWAYNNDYSNYQNQWTQGAGAPTSRKKPTYSQNERYQAIGQEENNARMPEETGKVPGPMSSTYGGHIPPHSNNYVGGKQSGQTVPRQYGFRQYGRQFSAYNYGASDQLPQNNYKRFQSPPNIQFSSSNDERRVPNGRFENPKNPKAIEPKENGNAHSSDSYLSSLNYQNQPVREQGYLNTINDQNYQMQPAVHEVPQKQYNFVPLYEMPQNQHQPLKSTYRTAGDDYNSGNRKPQLNFGMMSTGSSSNNAG